MEQVIRKIVEFFVLACAYIPMGAASLAFFASVIIFSKQVYVWVKSGIWALPKLHESLNMDFLHYLMDDRLSGIRYYLIKGAAKAASLPTPIGLLIIGTLCLLSGVVMLRFARAIKEAA